MLVRVFFSTRYSVDDPRSDLEAPVLGQQRGHRAFQASLDGLDLGDVARVRHGLTSTKENGRSRTVRLAYATRGGTCEVLACAGALLIGPGHPSGFPGPSGGPSCHSATGRSSAGGTVAQGGCG